jgi:hypothetical protein
VRSDDRPLLEAFRERFAVGHVRDVTTAPPWSPAAVWTVTSASDVLTGVALFEAAGLLGRKRRQFTACKSGALGVSRAKIARGPVEASIVDASRRALADATAYAPPPHPLRLDRGYADARTTYLSILRSWAETHAGALSCTAYEAARTLNPY